MSLEGRSESTGNSIRTRTAQNDMRGESPSPHTRTMAEGVVGVVGVDAGGADRSSLRRGKQHPAGFNTRTILLSLLAVTPGAMAQSCISLSGSSACPAFSKSSISTDSSLVGLFPFLAFVSDTTTFDQQLTSYVNTAYVQTKYQSLLGCGNVNLANVTNLYARFTKTVICNSIVQNSIEPCSLASADSEPVCANTCAEFAESEAMIAADNSLCSNPSSNAESQIRADFTNCALPAGSISGSGSCITGAENENTNCGFGNSTIGFCQYCSSGGQNSTDTCCYSSQAEERCAGVVLPTITGYMTFSTGIPTATATSSNSPSSSATNTAASDSSDGLSKGAIAGIVIGSIVGLALIIALIFLLILCLRRRRGTSQHGSVFNQPTPARRGKSSSMSYVPAPATTTPEGYEVLPGGRIARMSALEGHSGDSPPHRDLSAVGGGAAAGAAAGYAAGRRSRHHEPSSSDEYGDSPTSHQAGILRPPPTQRRHGSLSSNSVLGPGDDPSSPRSGSGDNMSSPQGIASQQSEQLAFFKDYYSQDEIHPGDKVATLWAYQPRAGDEFSLERGDMLKVVGIWDDGWATGVLIDERAEDWETKHKLQRDSGVSNTSGRREESPAASGEIKAFPLLIANVYIFVNKLRTRGARTSPSLIAGSRTAARHAPATAAAMNSRSSSVSFPVPRIQRRASSRLSFAISNAEHGEAPTGSNAVETQIDEEIEEIKRYEDFTTIDWVQDAAKEQLRRKIRRKETAGFFERGGRAGWRYKLWEAYEAAQGWIVVSLIGAAIGVNAACLNIITEWLSDIKLGHCKTAFYLNENFCCWGEDNGCDDWVRWSSLAPINYLLYILFATIFALTSATLVRSFAPYAAGSGISEIKCIIAGFVMKGFLGFWTLLIKSVALPLAIASGLSVGKEGPSVHYAVCTGNVISRLFEKYRRNASKTREILSACAAAGVAVAFGSPIGGVLFSLEEMSSYFPLKTMWRSYFCALVATAVLAAMNPFRTGQLVMFQVHYDRSWHFFEVLFYIIIGIFGGLYGAFVMKWNLRAQAFRKKYLTKYALLEATLLATATAVICYPNMFLRIDMTESMEILFKECEGGEDYNGLCDAENRWRMILSLALATVLRVFLVILSYGCKVPAGIFVPSMAIGASFGRTIGILVQALHEAYPGSVFFASCQPDVPCITPGTYAFLGAAAALSGIMHITVTVVVIMFELTGALTYILPTMIVVGVTKAVGELFGKGGIADRMIWFNGFPFLDNKEEHLFGVPVSKAMTTEITSIPSSGLSMEQVEQMLREDKYQGFPIVEDRTAKILIGYIGRTELRYAVDRVKRDRTINPLARCYFSPPASANPTTPLTPHAPAYFDAMASSSVDFSRFIDATPVTVHPRLPLETVMELFQKIGPRVILIEYHGKLAGLVTIKDCLKYQFKVEVRENPRDDRHLVESQERLWGVLRTTALWISDQLNYVSRGRIRIGRDERGQPSPSQRRLSDRGNADTQYMMNTADEVENDSVELHSR
ncbi:chloride channel protein [Phlyctema vagabunda]|uniref:Chloride channel protein n=1 Tax=Phlyctema vagabunda TaxID=108571 RepID=A0ABR4P999_9HELO